MKQLVYFIILITLPSELFAQVKSKITIDYVNKYKDIAIREMKRTGIPASITLAQGILESASGESELAKQYNNHFGIKCKTEWTGPKTYHDDDTKKECFRVYPDADSSYRDHANFIKFRPFYASLFELDPVDDSAWAYGLKKAGYATEKDYASRLLKLIDDYELAQYNFSDSVWAENKIPEHNNPDKSEPPKTVVIKKPILLKDTTPTKTPLKYPLYKKFRVNHTTAIWGEKGRSFLEIAKTYHIALYKLYKYNNLPQTDLIQNDQIIYLAERSKDSSNVVKKVAGSTKKKIIPKKIKLF